MYRIKLVITLYCCCCWGADHIQSSNLNASRDAADTISTENLLNSRAVLGKELEYIASEILSWKNLAGPSLVSMDMSKRLC